jgi:hypothetical protein
MATKSPRNHGEGDPESARRFNDAETAFVKSERGKSRIKKGPEVRPDEEAEIAKAEREASGRGKEDDSCSVMGTKNRP